MVFVGLQKGVCILWYIFGLGNHMGFQTCYIKSLLPVCGYGFSWKLQRHYSGQKNGFHGYYKILQRNGWKAWWQGYLIYCQRTCSSTSNYYCWSISFKQKNLFENWCYYVPSSSLNMKKIRLIEQDTYLELFPPTNSMISVHCFQCLSVSLIG